MSVAVSHGKLPKGTTPLPCPTTGQSSSMDTSEGKCPPLPLGKVGDFFCPVYYLFLPPSRINSWLHRQRMIQFPQIKYLEVHMNTIHKHDHQYSECFRIICAITWHGGGDHAHCKVCGVAVSSDIAKLQALFPSLGNVAEPDNNWFELSVEGTQY